jgi:hypothetical protein
MQPSQYLRVIRQELPEMPDRDRRIIAAFAELRTRFTIILELKQYYTLIAQHASEDELQAMIHARNAAAIAMLEGIEQRKKQSDN